MKLNDKKLVKIFILILIILPIVAGCGQKKESPVHLYKEAEALQKQAEEYYQKKDYSNALQKYHLAIEKAKESAKSDWNLPNFLIEKCEKEIALIEKRTVVVMETSEGVIKIELYEDKFPVTVKNFLRYVEEKFYDGTIFHRVIDSFMIQGGGFTADLKQKQTHEPIRNEAKAELKNRCGTIAMARTSIVDSATAQFFINVVDNSFLDHKDETPHGFGYAVFGEVIEGMDIVDRILKTETATQSGMQDVPVKPVVIKSIRLMEEDEKERQRKEEEVKRRVQEEEQKRQETRAKKLPKIKATISGGVWVIKGGGASDILRGLDIYLCQSELPKSEVKDILQELSDKFLKESESHERSAEKQTFLADSSRNWAKKYKAAYDLTQLLLQREDTAKISLEGIHGLIIIANEDSYSEEFTFSNIKGDMILPKLIAKTILAKATTDIDGKYQIENISGGEYVLYAISMSSFSIIDWMVPVEIKQEGNIKIDLYNQNAARIVNKSD